MAAALLLGSGFRAGSVLSGTEGLSLLKRARAEAWFAHRILQGGRQKHTLIAMKAATGRGVFLRAPGWEVDVVDCTSHPNPSLVCVGTAIVGRRRSSGF